MRGKNRPTNRRIANGNIRGTRHNWAHGTCCLDVDAMHIDSRISTICISLLLCHIYISMHGARANFRGIRIKHGKRAENKAFYGTSEVRASCSQRSTNMCAASARLVLNGHVYSQLHFNYSTKNVRLGTRTDRDIDAQIENDERSRPGRIRCLSSSSVSLSLF